MRTRKRVCRMPPVTILYAKEYCLLGGARVRPDSIAVSAHSIGVDASAGRAQRVWPSMEFACRIPWAIGFALSW